MLEAEGEEMARQARMTDPHDEPPSPDLTEVAGLGVRRSRLSRARCHAAAAGLLFIAPACLVALIGASRAALRASHSELIKFGWPLVPVAVGMAGVMAAAAFALAYVLARFLWHRCPVATQSNTWAILFGTCFAVGFWYSESSHRCVLIVPIIVIVGLLASGILFRQSDSMSDTKNA